MTRSRGPTRPRRALAREEREDPRIIEPTDAIIRLTATCICGSDLWPYRGAEPVDHQVMGHQYVDERGEAGVARVRS